MKQIEDILENNFKSDYLKFKLLQKDQWGTDSSLKEQIKEIKGKSLKYKEVHEILSKYDSSYTKRKLTYYIDKGLIPEPIKTAPNQAEYSLEHIVCFLIIDSMKEYLDREDIKKYLDSIKEGKKNIKLIHLLSLYSDFNYINKISEGVFEKLIDKNNLTQIMDIFRPDKFAEEEKNKKNILTTISKSTIYFLLGKYFMDLFNEEIKNKK